MSRDADAKVILAGTMYVGKTCLVTRYVTGQFDAATSNSLGAAFNLKVWGPYQIALWDTAGMERYQGLNKHYYRNASAVLLCFDLTDRDSFDQLEAKFFKPISQIQPDCYFCIVGCKLDLVDAVEKDFARTVTFEEGQALARKLNPSLELKEKFPYFETSSLLNDGVEAAFEHVFKALLSEETAARGLNERSLSLVEPQRHRKSKCCGNS